MPRPNSPDLFQLALTEVEEDCVARGRPEDFAMFRRYDLEAPDRGESLRYGDLAAEFDVPPKMLTFDKEARLIWPGDSETGPAAMHYVQPARRD